MAGAEVGVNVKLAAVLARESALRETPEGGRSPALLSVAAICRELGISRQTFYTARDRFEAEGVLGLLPRSRRPRCSPGQTPVEVEDAVVRLRKQLADDGWDNGAVSIGSWLQREGVVRVPSTATINRILARRGLVVPQPQKRPRASYQRFGYTERNGCWQIDAFVWKLADGTSAVVFEVLDDCTRLELEALAAPSENAEAALACFLTAVDRYGPPAMLLTDNGVAFSGRRRGWQSSLEQAAIALDVRPIPSRPHHPQTCGKNERAHQTCKRWLRHQPAADTLPGLQAQLDTYRQLYNTVRPHQALGGKTPSEAASAVPTATPTASAPSPTSMISTGRVTQVGVVRVSGCDIGIGRRYAGLTVTTIRTGDHVLILNAKTPLAEITLDRSRRYQPANPHA
jgi:transposase InsO family protein